MNGTGIQAELPVRGFERRDFRADQVRARRTAFTFPLDIPRYWVNGDVARTHLMNSLHMFLPPFERMITQMVRHKVLPLLSDPALIEQARGFMAQESIHGRSHELFFDNLRAQGYDLDRYLSVATWVFFDLFEKKLGTRVSLAMLASFEHYTALIVPLILRGDFLDGCDPRVRELLVWHAAEEVEHTGVAFAMLQAIDDGQGLRLAGNVLGLTVIFGSLLAGTAVLLQQDGKLTDRKALSGLGEILFGKYRVVQDAARLFVEYCRPGYRPGDPEYVELARQVLAPEQGAGLSGAGGG